MLWGWLSWAGALARGSDQPCFCPDISESAWRGRLAPRSVGPKRQPGDHGADPEAPPAPQGRPQTPACDPRTLSSKLLLSPPAKNGESHIGEGLASLVLDAQRPTERGRLRKVQTVPRLLPEGPEASTLCLPLTSVNNQLPTLEFFPSDPGKAFPERRSGPSSFNGQPKSRLRPEQEPGLQGEGAGGVGPSGGGAAGVPGQGPAEECHLPCPEDPQDAGGDSGMMLGVDQQIPEGAGEPGSAASDQVGEGVFCMTRGQGGSPGPGAAPRQQGETGHSVRTVSWELGYT